MRSGHRDERSGEQGFVLVGLIVAIFLILLILSIAAPKVARGLRRDREVESEHRAQQYTRAIRVYYQKLGHYPGSIEQLEKTNNIRFLRQRYVDPLTGKADWRLIHQGEAKTTVKGLFGQPLGGLATSGLGSAAGNASAGGIGSTVGSSGSFSAGSAGTAGSSGASGFGGGSGTSGFGGSSQGTSGFGGSSGSSSSGTSGSGPGGFGSSTVGSTTSGSLGAGVSNGFGSTGGPIMGIGSSATGDAILVVNEQTTYPTWEFLYDPRIEALSKGVNLLGGGVSSTGAGGLGSASGLSSGFGTAPGAAGTGAAGSPGLTGGAGAAGAPPPDNEPPGSGLPTGAGATPPASPPPN